MNNFTYQNQSPYQTFEMFSQNSGIPVNTVRNMVKEGRLPIRTKLRSQDKPLINMLALAKEAFEQAQSY